MKRLKWIFILLCVSTIAHAAKDEVVNTNTVFNLVQDLSVESQQYFDVTSTLTWNSDFKIKAIANEFTFGIDESYLQIDPYFSYKVIFDVSWEELVGTSLTTQSVTGIELEINYDPSAPYKDRAVYTFANGLKVDITNIRLYKEDLLNNYLPSAVDRQNLFLKSSVETEYYGVFDRFLIPGVSTSDITLSQSGTELQVNWLSIEDAETYELEWTWVHSYSGDLTGSIANLLAQNAIQFDFKDNATRVRLSKNEYSIPLTYRHGFLLVRYRGIGIGGANLDIPIEGSWCAAPISGTVDLYPIACKTQTWALDNNQMNYSAQMGYVEDGTRGVAVQFMDGTGKPRQTLS